MSASSPSRWGNLNEGDLVLIDSAPLIYWLDDYPEFAARFEALFDLHERAQIQIAISTIAVAEVLAGPFKAKQEVLAKQYEKALASFEIVPVSVEIAVSAARLRSTAGLRLPDAIVAATALEIGATALVTHDRDFSKLQGLRVLSGQL